MLAKEVLSANPPFAERRPIHTLSRQAALHPPTPLSMTPPLNPRSTGIHDPSTKQPAGKHQQAPSVAATNPGLTLRTSSTKAPTLANVSDADF